ncbi:MAG: hypothetical protein WC575_02805 [Patescibacteria group bacterium]
MKQKSLILKSGYLILLTLVHLYLLGLALNLSWNWFIVPVLGIKMLGTFQAIGVIILLKILKYQPSAWIFKKEADFWSSLDNHLKQRRIELSWRAAYTLSFLSISYCVHQLII